MNNHELPMNPEPNPPVVARIRVMGKDWQLLYLSLPVGTHDLYAREFSYHAYDKEREEGAVIFTRDEVKKHENYCEDLPVRVEQLRKALFDARDTMRVMADWVKKSDPAGHDWGMRMVGRANDVLSGAAPADAASEADKKRDPVLTRRLQSASSAVARLIDDTNVGQPNRYVSVELLREMRSTLELLQRERQQGADAAMSREQTQAGEIEVEIESVGSCMLQTRRDGNGRLKVFMPQITVADILQRVKVQAEHVDLRPAPYPAHGEPGALEKGDAL